MMTAIQQLGHNVAFCGGAEQPPVWRYDRDDLRAYSKFVKKVEIWKLQVAPYMTPKEMALALYNSLHESSR